MAAIYRVLGQSYPSPATETVLYTCATTSVIISSLFVCNQSTVAADTFTVRVCIGGAGDTNAQILFNLSPIPGATMLSLVSGITLANGDVLKVTSTNGTCSFNLFGQENS